MPTAAIAPAGDLLEHVRVSAARQFCSLSGLNSQALERERKRQFWCVACSRTSAHTNGTITLGSISCPYSFVFPHRPSAPSDRRSTPRQQQQHKRINIGVVCAGVQYYGSTSLFARTWSLRAPAVINKTHTHKDLRIQRRHKGKVRWRLPTSRTRASLPLREGAPASAVLLRPLAHCYARARGRGAAVAITDGGGGGGWREQHSSRLTCFVLHTDPFVSH
jgi:hypothetical protein